MAKESEANANRMGAGIAIGVAIGLVIGAAIDNTSTGIAVGIAIGAGIGAAWNRQQRMKNGKSESSETPDESS